jgi:hypothetical protein
MGSVVVPGGVRSKRPSQAYVRRGPWYAVCLVDPAMVNLPPRDRIVGASRPSLVARHGAAALTVLSFATLLACGSPSLIYRGTGTLRSSGDAADDLAADSVIVTSCRWEPQSFRDEPGRVAFLEIGDRCTIEGHWSDSTFFAQKAGRCTLGGAKHERTLRVTDVVARYGSVRSGRSMEIDRGILEVTVGGDETGPDGHATHALYHFLGTPGSSEPSRCSAIRDL